MGFVPRCTFTSILSVCCMLTFDFGLWKHHAHLSPVFFQGRFLVGVNSLRLIFYTLNLLSVLCTFMVYCVHLTYLCTILFIADIFGFSETIFLENLIEIQKELEIKLLPQISFYLYTTMKNVKVRRGTASYSSFLLALQS